MSVAAAWFYKSIFLSTPFLTPNSCLRIMKLLGGLGEFDMVRLIPDIQRFPPDDKSAKGALSGNGVVGGVIFWLYCSSVVVL